MVSRCLRSHNRGMKLFEKRQISEACPHCTQTHRNDNPGEELICRCGAILTVGASGIQTTMDPSLEAMKAQLILFAPGNSL